MLALGVGSGRPEPFTAVDRPLPPLIWGSPAIWESPVAAIVLRLPVALDIGLRSSGPVGRMIGHGTIALAGRVESRELTDTVRWDARDGGFGAVDGASVGVNRRANGRDLGVGAVGC